LNDEHTGPIGDGERLGALDATRGLALFGIFLVNVQLMARPLGEVLDGAVGGDGGWSTIAWHASHVLAEGRSFPLFSMLFGMGMALQLGRAAGAGRKFWPTHVRRVLALAVIGLLHAILLWFGDILFYYACAGVVLLAFTSARVKTLVTWGVSLWGVTTLIMALLVLLSQLVPPDAEAAAAESVQAAGASVRDLIEGMKSGQATEPSSPLWVAAETRAMRDGPYADATLMRLILWASGLVFYFLITGHILMILGLFLIGMAMVRSNVLTDPMNPWPKRLAIVGLGVVLPISLVLSYLSQHAGTPLGNDLAKALHSSLGPAQSMGYLGVILLLYRRARRGSWLGLLEAAGRMPLTNYLTQSAVGGVVFQHWGLAQFGEWRYGACLGLVVGTFALQLVVSHAWMTWFRFGPMEWLWRTLSYGRMPAMRRGRAGAITGE
jgi:uncharacterized protein